MDASQNTTVTLAADPAPVADPDAAARRSLRRHKAFATGLLLAMAALTVASYRLPPGYWTGALQAAARAGFIGGIADWFAVTALFRRPLGLPIPHTAIIPAQKARLGRALGRFVGNHVFTEAEVRRTVGRLDLAGIIAHFFADPQAMAPAAAGIAALLPKLLATVEDGRARRILARLIPRLVGGPAAGRLVARAMRILMEGGRHQEVFSFILAKLKLVLAEREDALRHAIEERVREQGGRLVGWALGASIARRVLTQINAELDKMQGDGSELREAFDEWMRREMARMEEDPTRAAEIGRALRQVVAHDTVRAWASDIWSRLRVALEADATRANGHTVAFIAGALGNLGVMLETDPAARARLQRAAEGILVSFLPAAQAQVSGFIADVVGNWDSDTIVERLELRVGADLQYVRVNGTLVGFLAGGVLYAVLRAMFGAGGF
jgi:uncharacterized membrane-anchored protein YjiN (DUF445 family)